MTDTPQQIEPADATDEVAPLLETRALSLVGPRGSVFGPVDLTVAPAELVVVGGRAGSGRSALLLALTGRMAGLRGAGRLGEDDLITAAARVRRRTTVARIGGLVELEPQLTVAESSTERALADAVPATAARRRIDMLAAVVGLDLVPDRLVGELSRLDQARLALVLAGVRPAELIVFDDVDRDLDRLDQADLYAALAAVAATGPAVVASAIDTSPVPAGIRVIDPR